MSIWIIMILGGLATFLTRLSFILMHGRKQFPHWLQRSLNYVPPAVLTAIIVPEILLHSGQIDISFNNSRLLAGILAILISYLTRSTLITILFGMIALWLLQLAQ